MLDMSEPSRQCKAVKSCFTYMRDLIEVTRRVKRASYKKLDQVFIGHTMTCLIVKLSFLNYLRNHDKNYCWSYGWFGAFIEWERLADF
jgi:hypothetical protein